MINILEHNRVAWDRESQSQSEWSTPVSPKVIAAARKGEWGIVLTPRKDVPRTWFPELQDKEILCLAGAGGQQAPILAAAGGRVTVFDNSPVQLRHDQLVAERDGLDLTTVQGDMADLSVFEDGRFDLVVHPCSNCFVPDLRPVWSEAFRVLDHGGLLLSGFLNPLYYLFDRDLDDQGVLQVTHALPYSDVTHLGEERLRKKLEECLPLEFGHTLEQQIGWQLEAGFMLTALYEDHWSDEATGLNPYTATSMATRAYKP